MNLLILFVSLALGISFLCSVMEAVLLSITPSHVAMLEKQGRRVAVPLRLLKDNIDRPLVGILTLNTIANTGGAAGAGAQATAVFGDAVLGVFSGCLTLAILLFAEIVPKTLGAVYWRQLTVPVVHLMRAVIVMLYPVVRVLEWLTKWLSKGQGGVAQVSREEVGALAELGVRHGVLHQEESKLVRSLLRFRTLRVQDVMTPRTVLYAEPQIRTVGDMLESLPKLTFSRIPIYTKNIDDITGYVLKDQLLIQAAHNQHDTQLAKLRRDLMVVPNTARLPQMFDRMINKREHIALVVDEYGGTAGVVTMEDIVETLLGLEIVDELDSTADMQAYARKAWQERARQAHPDLPLEHD